MKFFIEKPYIATLKEIYLKTHCSWCFKLTTNDQCLNCEYFIYCNEICKKKDEIYHKIECEFYQKRKKENEDLTIIRMIIRSIIRLENDQRNENKKKKDFLIHVPETIERRSWSDLLSHRDEILQSDRHRKLWLKTKNDFDHYFSNQFNNFDLLEIFGKILINRFRVGIHENLIDGRLSIGWAIYLTTSVFNHSCQPDLFQCSFDINIRLKLSNSIETIPNSTKEFHQLTISYRHQNDFRLENSLTYVPTRDERRKFLEYFFFICHCNYCSNERIIHYQEMLSLFHCCQCQDYLILRKDFSSSTSTSTSNRNQWILICLGRKQCSLIDQIQQRITMENIQDNSNQSILIDELNLKIYENYFHSQSLFLIQKKEKLFFSYQKSFLEKNQQIQFDFHRFIQLGQDLKLFYDQFFQDSSIYPKIFLSDFISILRYQSNQEQIQFITKQLHQLWNNDYSNLVHFI